MQQDNNNNNNNNKDKKDNEENVLIFQGGGSLGAYEAGVYKTLAKHKIQFAIIGGTSIGAVNAAILLILFLIKRQRKITMIMIIVLSMLLKF